MSSNSIFKGDNTAAFGGNFLTIKVKNPQLYKISKLIFSVNGGIIQKPFKGEDYNYFQQEETLLTVNFTSQETQRLSALVTQIGTNQTNISTINGKIPSAATTSNQLADKQYVDDAITTNSASFDGSWATYAAIPSTVAGFTSENLPEPTNNNYLVVLADETQDGGKLIQNPDYEKQKENREKERISHLKCTKRVFVLMLEQMGLDYFEQILPEIKANRQAELEWELCVELERANPLLDVMGKKLGITSEQIDKLFKYANGEITQEEFING